MIKKIIFLFTVIVAVSTTNLSYQLINNNDYRKISATQDHIAINESKETNVLDMSFNKENLNQKIKKIINYCQSHHITFTMLTGNNKQGVEILNYYVYTNNQQLFNDLKIAEKDKIDFSDISQNYYYTTLSNDPYSNGTLRTIQKDFFENEDRQFNIYNMYNIETAIKDNGYRIMGYFYLNNQSNKFDELLNMFNEENISIENITDGYAPAQLEFLNQQSIEQIQTVLVLSIIVTALLLCLYFLKSKHKIMIKRLNGVSVFKIIFKDICLFFVFNILLFGISLLLMTYYMCGSIDYTNQDMYKLASSIILGVIGLHILLFIFFYIFVYFTSSIKYLKKGFAIKHFMELTVLLKVLIIAFLIPQFLPMASNVFKSISDYTVISSNKDKLENMAYFDSYSDLSDIAIVFDHYIEHEGIYVDFDYYTNNQEAILKERIPEEYWHQLEEMIVDFPMIYANANYLKDHEIKDVKGNILDLKQYKEDVLLVPERYAKENLDRAMYSQKREIVYIEDSDTYFNFKLRDPYLIKNPVIHLVTHISSEVNLGYMFLPTDDKSIGDYQKEIAAMSRGEADIQDMGRHVDSDLTNIEEQLKETMVVFIIYLVFIITLIYQAVYLYIHENQLKISLAYMNGYSRKQRYQELFIYIPLTYIFIIITGIFILKLNILQIIIFCLFSMGIELLTHFIVIRQFELKNIAAILKGESEL